MELVTYLRAGGKTNIVYSSSRWHTGSFAYAEVTSRSDFLESRSESLDTSLML